MEASPFSGAQFASRPLVRGVVACLGLPPRQAPTVSRHVLPAEPSGAGVDAPPGPAKSPWLDFENCRAGLQYRGRGLFNPLDHSLGAAGLKSAIESGGYLQRNTELRRKRHLQSGYLKVCQFIDFRTVDPG